MPKGVKYCKQCLEPHGPRAAVCKKCGTAFEFAAKKVPEAQETVKTEGLNVNLNTKAGRPFQLLYVPGCMPHSKEKFCPFDPVGNDEYAISTWADNLHNYEFWHMGRPTRYSRLAIICFAEHYWPVYKKGLDGMNPDYKKAVDVIKFTVPLYEDEED